jgi:hypothetical protein|nr:MAG TPA: hypothetical protein [Caudoviricetes sp.]
MMMLEHIMNPPDSPYTKYRGVGFTPDKMTKAQIDTIKKLVEARLVSGASYE